MDKRKRQATTETAFAEPSVAPAPPTGPRVVGLGDLHQDPRNARRRTDRSASLIHRSLETYGAARSIVVDENGRVLAGNGTVEAAAAVGIERVLVVPADGNTLIAVQRTDLTETQKTAYAIADNRTSDLSEWDAATIADLKDADPDLSLAPWFTDDEIEKLLGEQGLGPEEEEKKPEQGSDSMVVKLTFEQESDFETFLDGMNQLARIMSEHATTEQRLQALMDKAIGRS